MLFRSLSWNELDGTLEARSVTAVHPGPPAPMLRIDCADGLRLHVTPPHRLMTAGGWERAGLLKVDREWITVLPPGRMLVRVISMVFDRYLREGRQRASYSKVI